MNDLHLYNRVKDIELKELEDIKIQLIQGVPTLQCGKTTTLLNNYRAGDLVLFPTREGADDFRKRFQELHPECEKNHSRQLPDCPLILAELYASHQGWWNLPACYNR